VTVKDPIPERDGDKLKVFIPATLAAICADCEGVFLLPAGACPGCGSHQYVVMKATKEGAA